MDTLRATGRIYHAKNLHSARSTSKEKGTEFEAASGHREKELRDAHLFPGVTEIGQEEEGEEEGGFKMRDSADVGQSVSLVNITVLPQHSKTERVTPKRKWKMAAKTKLR